MNIIIKLLLFGFTHFTISFLIPVVDLWLHHTACALCIRRKGRAGGGGGGGWGHPQGDMYMVAARLGCKKEPWLGLGGLTAWAG